MNRSRLLFLFNFLLLEYFFHITQSRWKKAGTMAVRSSARKKSPSRGFGRKNAPQSAAKPQVTSTFWTRTHQHWLRCLAGYLFCYLALSALYTWAMRSQLRACTEGTSENSVVFFFQALLAKHSPGCRLHGFFVTKIEGWSDIIIAALAGLFYQTGKGVFGHAGGLKSTSVTLVSDQSGKTYCCDFATLTCTCKDWVYRRSQADGAARVCRHLQIVLADLAQVPVANDAQIHSVLPLLADASPDADENVSYLCFDNDDARHFERIAENRVVLFEG